MRAIHHQHPSRADLAGSFDEETAAALWQWLTATSADVESHPAARRYLSECVRRPLAHDVRMHVLCAAAGFDGVECMWAGHRGREPLTYLRRSDPRLPTLAHFAGHYTIRKVR
jgi:hypothetical protein